MDRLTGWDNGHAYFTECFEEPCLGMGCINEDCEFKILACQRLAEYEDIGLTPEQLLEIDKMYSEKCREVAELKRFKDFFHALYGEGLEIANWHLNGDTEPFDNFYNVAEGA